MALKCAKMIKNYTQFCERSFFHTIVYKLNELKYGFFTVEIRIVDINDKSEPISNWEKVRIIFAWCR